MKSSLPHIVELEQPDLIENGIELANAFYTPQNNMPDAGGYAYSEVEYPTTESDWSTSWQPGETWAKEAGDKNTQSAQCWVTTLDILENYCTGAGLAEGSGPYLVVWSKDVLGNYSASWKNTRGQVIKTARTSKSDHDLPIQERELIVKTYEYYDDGRLKKEKTPLDVQNNADDFAIIKSYNERGQLIGEYSPAKGLERYWYSKRGRLRFSQTDKQRADGWVMAYNYDYRGRLQEQLLQRISGGDEFIQDEAEYLSSATGVNRYLKGNAYDSVGACLDGIAKFFSQDFADAIESEVRSLNLKHLTGRKVCQYNTNKELYADLDAQKRAVIDFYSYDVRGRTVNSWKYVGATESPTNRWRGVYYTWDDLERLKRVYFIDKYTNILHKKVYHYDGRGRITHLTDENGDNLVAFEYDDLEQLKKVQLADGIIISYKYHLHGGVQEIQAIRKSDQAVLFTQKLGYEKSAMPGYRTEDVADGKIRSTLLELPGMGADPVKLSLFDFDELGRMTHSMSFSSNEPVVGTFTEDKSQLMYQDFDDNNRRIYRGVGVGPENPMLYHYEPKTWKLDHVKGKTQLAPDRDMSMVGTFQYDLDENMIYDASKDLTIKYDNYNLPIEFVREPLEGKAYKQFNLYDYHGQRVSSLSWGKVNVGGFIDTPPVNEETENPENYGDADPQWEYYGAKHYFTIDGRKRSEIIERPEQDAAEFVALQGIGSQIGRIRPDKSREYYLKNHQGSLLKSVDAAGQDMYILDYMPYGAQTVHYAKDGDIPSEQYTGKEYDPFLALTYYGARYFDPVLAVWSVPDPAGQFSNPYYFGGDPLNYVDPDGEFIAPIIVGALIGAYMGAAMETGSWRLDGYNLFEDWDETLLGASIGALSAGAGSIPASMSGGIMNGAVAGGVFSGMTGGLGNYALQQYSSGAAGIQSWSGTDAFMGLWTGGVSGMFGGLAANAVHGNIFGDIGRAFVGGASSGAFNGMLGAAMNGYGFTDYQFYSSIGKGAAIGGGFGILSNGLTDVVENYVGEGTKWDGSDIANDGRIKHGDIVVMESLDGLDVGDVIDLSNRTDASHTAIIERGADGEMFVREANATGSEVRVELSNYKPRNYKIVQRGQKFTPFNESLSGYNLLNKNCTTQAQIWSGQSTGIINPGTYASYHLGGGYTYLPFVGY